MQYTIRALVEIEDDGKDLSGPLNGRMQWALNDYMVLDANERKATLLALQVRLEPVAVS